MNLFLANRQWSSRPEDERFPTLQALYDATKGYAESAREKTVTVDQLRTEAVDGDVQLTGKLGIPARFTHWAFGQICPRVGAPAAYMRDLPATLAAKNRNSGRVYGISVGSAVVN